MLAGGEADAPVFFGVFNGDPGGLVARTVIPDQQIEIRIGLCKYAFDGRTDISFPVLSSFDH